MSMTTSFICEHTAEFTLTRQLERAFSAQGYLAVPFYYWAQREGGTMSSQVNREMFRLFGVFARRPKLTPNSPNAITVKLNQDVIDAGHFGKHFGLPLFAGLPIARSLVELSDCCCLWKVLDDSVSHESEHTFKVVEDRVERVGEWINTNDLVSRCTNLRLISWGRARELIDQLRLQQPKRHWLFGITYKPFYVALFDSHGRRPDRY